MPHERIDRAGFAGEAQPGYTTRPHGHRGSLQCQADESDWHAVIGLDHISRKNSLATSFIENIGGEILEFGSAERDCRTRFCAPTSVLVPSKATARLHTQQFLPAFIEFMVADRADFQTQAVHRLDSAFIMVQAGNQGAGANQVAC